MFSLDEGPGVLFKALAVFALRDINLSKVTFRKEKKSFPSLSLPHYITLHVFTRFNEYVTYELRLKVDHKEIDH